MRTPCTLVVCLLLCSPLSAQVLAEEPPATAWQQLDLALVGLDQAITQHTDPAMWTDVRGTAERALEALASARAMGAPADLCLATQRTFAVLLRRQDELERQQFSGDEAWDAALLAALVDDLLFAEGRLPDTSFLLAETLFLLERDDEGQDALARALVLWPENARLHEATRVWQDVLPRPMALAAQLSERAGTLGATSPAQAGLLLETVGQLQLTLGRREYQAARAAGDPSRYAAAGLLFQGASRTLLRSLSMPARLSSDALDKLRGDALVNAAYSHLGRARLVWQGDRLDSEEAPSAMALAEAALMEALRLDRENVAYQDAVLFVGQEWLDKGRPQRATSADMDDARGFYGRMAVAFDDADWWNNRAFLSREMGTAAETRGDMAAAEVLYREALEAYERSIELSPDNARFVNDTGLMLLYHLHDRLDEAEELFRRAWALGKEVCDNPFVERPVHDENFSAYTDAMLNLARLYHERGEVDRALAIAQELVELAPDRPDAAMQLALIEKALPARDS